MHKYQVSVVVGIYNPIWEKLKSTLLSIVVQKNIDYELIITDDGSRNDCFDYVIRFLDKNGIKKYKLIKNPINKGTVANILTALKAASGKYTYLISPGDMLYKNDTLLELYNFMEKNKAKVCFGNAVYYSYEKDNLIIKKHRVNAPPVPESFSKDYPMKKTKLDFFSGNYILGAAFFRERTNMIYYLEKISHISKYVEDNTTTAFMLADNMRIYHFDTYVVWYEDGTGVSTSGNKKWDSLLKKDFDNCFKKILTDYPNDCILKGFMKIFLIRHKLIKFIYAAFFYPKILFHIIQFKMIKKQEGNLKKYDKNILKKYLLGGKVCK